jgi:hypothetical protein
LEDVAVTIIVLDPSEAQMIEKRAGQIDKNAEDKGARLKTISRCSGTSTVVKTRGRSSFWRAIGNT